MTRRLRLALLALIAVLALTGCMKMSSNFVLSESDTFSGTSIVAFDKKAMEGAGMSVDDMMNQVGSTPPPGASVTSYDDGTYAGQEYTYTDASIEMMSNSNTDGEISLVHNGDNYEFSGSVDLTTMSTYMDSNSAPLDITYTITFPGAVVSGNGDINGNTISWHTDKPEMLTMEAVGSAISNGQGQAPATGGSAGGFPMWAIIAIAAVVVLGALAAFLLTRKKKPAADGYAGPGGPGYGQPYAGPSQPGQGYQQPYQGSQPPQAGQPYQPPQAGQPYQPPQPPTQ